MDWCSGPVSLYALGLAHVMNLIYSLLPEERIVNEQLTQTIRKHYLLPPKHYLLPPAVPVLLSRSAVRDASEPLQLPMDRDMPYTAGLAGSKACLAPPWAEWRSELVRPVNACSRGLGRSAPCVRSARIERRLLPPHRAPPCVPGFLLTAERVSRAYLTCTPHEPGPPAHSRLPPLD